MKEFKEMFVIGIKYWQVWITILFYGLAAFLPFKMWPARIVWGVGASISLILLPSLCEVRGSIKQLKELIKEEKDID